MSATPPRSVDVVVLSDVHLGTRSCRAAELNAYLKSVRPGRLILVGDIVDLWHQRQAAWTIAQTKLVRRVLKLSTAGVPVHYLIGNHDEALRRYAPFIAGSLRLEDELVLDLAGVPTWFVHGDQADHLIETPAWLAAMGSWSYDVVQWIGDRIDGLRVRCGLPRRSLAALVKKHIPSAHLHAERFASTMARLAADRGHRAVVCGHIHIPADRTFLTARGPVRYLNSGDWVDSLSALEWHQGRWQVVRWSDLVATGAVAPVASEAHLVDTVAVSPELAA